jgi:demethoxyubiquinone hydroxylase (CLK1/Coq7/Cat5 family)
MKSLYEISKEIEIPKMRIYRYVVKHGIKESAIGENQKMLYGAEAEKHIKEHFERCEHVNVTKNQKNDTSADILDILAKELEAKNKQIESLQATIQHMAQAQTLNMLPQMDENKGFIKRIKWAFKPV